MQLALEAAGVQFIGDEESEIELSRFTGHRFRIGSSPGVEFIAENGGGRAGGSTKLGAPLPN
jgi:hypothetical protein